MRYLTVGDDDLEIICLKTRDELHRIEKDIAHYINRADGKKDRFNLFYYIVLYNDPHLAYDPSGQEKNGRFLSKNGNGELIPVYAMLGFERVERPGFRGRSRICLQ